MEHGKSVRPNSAVTVTEKGIEESTNDVGYSGRGWKEAILDAGDVPLLLDGNVDKGEDDYLQAVGNGSDTSKHKRNYLQNLMPKFVLTDNDYTCG